MDLSPHCLENTELKWTRHAKVKTWDILEISSAKIDSVQRPTIPWYTNDGSRQKGHGSTYLCEGVSQYDGIC